jgi:hypothetical protein
MLTPAQLQTLATDIAADPVLSAMPVNPDTAFAIADIYNTVVSPTFWIWRLQVGIDEIMQNGFDWTRVDNLTVGKARVWEWMAQTNLIRPSQANVRAGILTTFGTAGDLAMRTAIFGHCQTPATRVQKLFSTGSGTSVTDQGIGPATTLLTEPLTYQEVLTARGL